MGGKSGGAGKAHNYYGDLAGALCLGPVDEYRGLIADKKLIDPKVDAWDAAKSYPDGSIVAYKNRAWQWNNVVASTAGTAPPNGSWAVWKRVRTGNSLSITVATHGQATLYWGTPNQVLEPSSTLLAQNHPAYRGVCLMEFQDWLFGRERQSPESIEVLLARKPRQTIIVGTAANLDADGQCNPWCFLAELLTDPVNGLGIPAAELSAGMWQLAADDALANSATLYISPILREAKSVRQVIAQLLQYVDGFLRHDAEGRIEPGRFIHNQAPPSFTAETTIDQNDLTVEPEINPDSYAETANQVYVSFTDRLAAFKEDSVPFVSLLNRRIVGESRSSTIRRPWITRRDQAASHAAEFGRLIAEPGAAATISVRRTKAKGLHPLTGAVEELQPGSLFLFNHDVLQVSLPCRVIERTLLEPPSETMRISFEVERGMAAVPYHPPTTDLGSPQLPDPESITIHQVFQVPPAFDGGEDARIVVLAARTAPLTTGLDVWFRESDTANFYKLGNQVQWGLQGTLSQDYISSVATSSRSRTSNVATVVTAAAHGLSTGNKVTLSGMEDGYNVVDVTVTVVNGTTFTFASVGADQASAAWTTGLVEMRPATGVVPQDDTSGILRVQLHASMLVQDIEKLTETQTADAVNDDNLLLIVFKASDRKVFEVLTIRDVTVVGAGLYSFTVRRARLQTERGNWYTGDHAWIIHRDALVAYAHTDFARYLASGTQIRMRLASVNPKGTADIANTAVCPDVLYTWADPFLPAVEWVSLKRNGADITDFTVNFATTDAFEFTVTFKDANGDLTNGSLVAKLGSTERVLWDKPLGMSGRATVTIPFTLPSNGEWKICAVAKDARNRVRVQGLMYSGSPVTLKLGVGGGGGAVAEPQINPEGGYSHDFPKTVTITCATSGATIKYQIRQMFQAPGATWLTYSGPLTVYTWQRVWAYALKAGQTDSAQVYEDYGYSPW